MLRTSQSLPEYVQGRPATRSAPGWKPRAPGLPAGGPGAQAVALAAELEGPADAVAGEVQACVRDAEAQRQRACPFFDDELEGLGIRKEGKMSHELADGTVKEYPFGLVRIEFMGETTAGRVVFGEPGSEPLLGVTALESVGIMVDPASKTLRRLPAIPLKQAAAAANPACTGKLGCG